MGYPGGPSQARAVPLLQRRPLSRRALHQRKFEREKRRNQEWLNAVERGGREDPRARGGLSNGTLTGEQPREISGPGTLRKGRGRYSSERPDRSRLRSKLKPDFRGGAARTRHGHFDQPDPNRPKSSSPSRTGREPGQRLSKKCNSRDPTFRKLHLAKREAPPL